MEVKQFMVTFTFNTTLSHRFIALVPKHRAKVNEFMIEGKILSYSLCLESGILWTVFEASSEIEVLRLIKALPLAAFMEFDIKQLTFYNSSTNFAMAYSLN